MGDMTRKVLGGRQDNSLLMASHQCLKSVSSGLDAGKGRLEKIGKN